MKDRDKHSTTSTHVYEIRPRADKRGVDLISDALPYSPLWYRGPNAIRDAVGYARFYSGSHDAVIRVYDAAGNVIETQEHAGRVQRGGKGMTRKRGSMTRSHGGQTTFPPRKTK